MRKAFLSGLSVVSLLLFVSLIASAQDVAKNGTGSTGAGTSTPISADSSPEDLARAAIAGQGGEKFRNLKNLVLIGTVELYAPNSTQSLSGKFAIVTAGEKVRIDVTAPLLSFQQIFDGQNSYNSLPNMPPLPAPSTFGLPVLLRYNQPGYKVEAIPDQKKRRGFKITDAEGNSTDFFVDPSNGHLTGFLTQRNGYTFAVENTKTKEIDGVVVPVSFSWRLEMKQGAAFAEYTVKDAKLNQTVGDDVFTIPN
jgi:hypothetical protein